MFDRAQHGAVKSHDCGILNPSIIHILVFKDFKNLR